MFPKYEHRNASIYVNHRQPLKPCPVRFHTHLEVLQMESGKATVSIGGGRWELSAGDVYVVFPNVPHGVESANGSAALLIADMTQHPALHDLLIHKQPAQPVIGAAEIPGIVGSMFARMRDLPRNVSYRQMVLTGYANALLGELLRLMELTDRDVDDSLLDKLILFLLENYTRDLTLEETAKSLGYSKFYISRLISAAFGTNFRTLLNTYRVSMAQNLLAGSAQSIGRIADACGFKNQSSFNRVFIKQCGVTPSQYRRDMGQEPEKPTLYIR